MCRASQRAHQSDVMIVVDSSMGILNSLSMDYLGGTTNTAAALATMRNNMFTSGNGDRNNVHNIAVVITDGRFASIKAPLCIL